jgi:hypothetical protein
LPPSKFNRGARPLRRGLRGLACGLGLGVWLGVDAALLEYS